MTKMLVGLDSILLYFHLNTNKQKQKTLVQQWPLDNGNWHCLGSSQSHHVNQIVRLLHLHLHLHLHSVQAP